MLVSIRPPQDVDCHRPETPVLYLRNLVTNHEGRGQKLGRPRRDDFRDGNESFKDPGRQGRRRPKEPWWQYPENLFWWHFWNTGALQGATLGWCQAIIDAGDKNESGTKISNLSPAYSVANIELTGFRNKCFCDVIGYCRWVSDWMKITTAYQSWANSYCVVRAVLVSDLFKLTANQHQFYRYFAAISEGQLEWWEYFIED